MKIVPILPHGPNFNFSIWHVALMGHNNLAIVSDIYNDWLEHRETLALKLTLKHLRRYPRLLPAFQLLQQISNVELEDAILRRMHQALVMQGDWETVEEIIQTAANDNLFVEHCRNLQNGKFAIEWKCLTDEISTTAHPCPRGGHQIIPVPTQDGTMIVLFGGWSGTQDLDDLWIWKNASWRQISPVGPAPQGRSCHKLCFDSNRNQIYLLGSFFDQSQQVYDIDACLADFWRLDVAKMTWELISHDIREEYGPGLLYDHQMVHDKQTDFIYVFGGRDQHSGDYSGLYSFHIPTSRWTLISEYAMKPRIGHSMVLEGTKLYILGGFRQEDGEEKNLCDVQTYDVVTGEFEEECHDYTRVGGPEEGFTQRATLVPDTREIFLYCSSKKTSSTRVRNVLWVYSLITKKWFKVYEHGVLQFTEPQLRFAHQFEYDAVTDCHFLFGGTPGWNSINNGVRLGDLWQFMIHRYAFFW
jgi:hypothetical protein